jgi:uncharacterized protein YbjT (DUF2867 family)
VIPPSRPHALVVGGTGMLRAAVLGLAAGREVTVVARGRGDLDSLRRASASVHPAAVDYRDAAAFAGALDGAVAARGPFNLAVAWIRSDAPEAALAAARRVAGPFFHVLGSAAADPSRPDPGRRARFEALPGVAYREVILGFVVEGGRSRWLTDAEISRGVLDAVAADRSRTVVGAVDPWSARP